MELTLEQRIKNLERLVSALISASPDPGGFIRQEQRAIDAEINPPETRAQMEARIDREMQGAK